MKERPGFMLYFEMADALESIGNEEAGRLFKALMNYARTGQVSPLPDMAAFAFNVMRPRLDRDAEIYVEKCRKSAYSVYVRDAKRRNEAVMSYEEWQAYASVDIEDDRTISNSTQPNATPTTTPTATPTAAATAAAAQPNPKQPRAADAACTAVADRPVKESDGDSFSPALEATVSEWLRYKAERHERCTETAVRNLRARIRHYSQRWGESAVRSLVADCMAAGYRGIVFERLERSEGTPAEPPEDNVAWMRPYLEGRQRMRQASS